METIWLSHILDPSTTPHYAGSRDLSINKNKSLENGDSCNTSDIRITSHSGTHIDAPFHFFSQGKTIDAYNASFWIFNHPVFVILPAREGELIHPGRLKDKLAADSQADILLLKTDFEKNRSKKKYWSSGPGFAPELAGLLSSRFPNLRAFGIDCISISSLKHRQTGRLAHKSFLSTELLIIEDMRLSNLDEGKRLNKVICLPMRISNGDGAPCTIIGFIE